MIARIALVSSVRTKADQPRPAKDFYVSAWFTRARALVEQSHLRWFILSTAHGLVDPDTIIGPYECTLHDMSAAEGKQWAERVIGQINDVVPEADEVIVLAGRRYCASLLPYLQVRFSAVSLPLQGLSRGQQLNWLGNSEPL